MGEWGGDIERFGRAGELPYKRVMENMPIPEGIETWRDGEAVMYRWRRPEAARVPAVWRMIYFPCYLGFFLWINWNRHPYSRDSLEFALFCLVSISVMVYVFAATRVDRLTAVISQEGVRSTVGPLPWFRDQGVRAGEIHGVVTRLRALPKGKYVYRLMYIDRENRERQLLGQIGMREHAEMVAKSIGMTLRIPVRAARERSIPELMKVQKHGEVTTMIPSKRMQRVGGFILLGIAVGLVVIALRLTAVWLSLGAVLIVAAVWVFLDTQEISVSSSGVKSVGKPVSIGRNWEIPAANVLLPAIREVADSSNRCIIFEVTHGDQRNETRILAKCDMREQAEYIVGTIRETFGLRQVVPEEGVRV
jgi:hypothetical protein